MKLSMLKLLTIITLLSSVSLHALSIIPTEQAMDNQVVQFLQKSIAPNENYTLDKVTVIKKEPMRELDKWWVYFVRIDLNLIKQAGKKVSINDVVFTNGTVLSKDFVNLISGQSLKNAFSFTLDITDPTLYNKEHLLAGNMNAKHKLIVFSDPLCPFCMDFVPEVIDDVQKNPQTFALFYYHLPLTSIHPAAPTIVKAMILAEEKGDKHIVNKVYKAVLDTKETDEKAILAFFNETFKTNFTLEEINQPHIVKKMADDEALAQTLSISGTPTLYVDGKYINTKMYDPRQAYRKLIKESK